ncbi:hypothetical protein ACJIZ3_009245 [Penstemon smallii]|uniref:Uncharacterized protein n=1 Tax=Penstemon smallii TaxID=265156 RepID=A0ABD3TC13_9LAMI
MAHEALVSLNLLIERFLNIGYSHTHANLFSIAELIYEELRNIFKTAESVHEQVWSLKSILELHHFKQCEELNDLKGEILEAIPKFRDLLQDLINKSQLLFSESQSFDDELSDELKIIYQDLKKARKEMISFNNTTKNIIKDFSPHPFLISPFESSDVKTLHNKWWSFVNQPT